MNALNKDSFYIEPKGSLCRVIEVIKNELLTNEIIETIDFSKNNGIDIERDILKIAVCERHNYTNHIGVAFIKGIGLKKGAIASSVFHDSHNLVIVGTGDEEMALAGNTVIEMNGGLAVVEKGSVKAKMALPIAGYSPFESYNLRAG